MYLCPQVFRPGSTAPGTRLWDARELYEANNARCDKALRQLEGSLRDAVTTSIQAAGDYVEDEAVCPYRLQVIMKRWGFVHTGCRQLCRESRPYRLQVL